MRVWYCGYCSATNTHWRIKCERCGRRPQPQGTSAENTSTRCGDEANSPETQELKRAAFLDVGLRITFLMAGCGAAGWAVCKALPYLVHVWDWTCRAIRGALTFAVWFWLGTAMLPPVWCKRVRSTFWQVLRWAGRTVAQLVGY